MLSVPLQTGSVLSVCTFKRIGQVRTLYVKERKVRMQPHQWEEVERLTGLGEQEFHEVLHVARMGQYVGDATLTEGGLDLLAVQELINKEYGVAAAESHQAEHK